MREERRQSDAVVSRPRLFAERDDPIAALGVELDQPLAKALADHAVADDDDGLLALAEPRMALPTYSFPPENRFAVNCTLA